MAGNGAFCFVVPGRPVAKKTTTSRAKRGDPRARRSLAYQQAVAWCALAARCPQFEGLVGLTVRVFIRRQPPHG